MKIIIAYIDPSLVEPIAEALAGIGIIGATATTAKDFGAGKFKPLYPHGADNEQPFTMETQLEVITQDLRVDEAVEIIKTVCERHRQPAAKIIIKVMDDSVRIRDGGHGEDVL